MLQEAVESSGVSPVRGLDNLLSSASSSSLLQDAVQDLTTDTIQVIIIISIKPTVKVSCPAEYV